MIGDEQVRWAADHRPETALIARICQACVRTLQMTGAAVSVMTRAGHQGTVHATDAVAAMLDDLHFGLGEGPAVAAFHGRQAVFVDDLASRPRAAHWPAFTPAALELGVRSIAAFPLLIGAAELGVLVAHGGEPADFEPQQRTGGSRLADAASLALLDLMGEAKPYGGDGNSGNGHTPNGHRQDGHSGDGHSPDGGGDGAAFYRVEVYQAAGMVTVQLGVTIDEAMVRLRAYAYAHDLSVLAVSRAVVRRELVLGADNG
jgi:hypothetical protein